MHSDLIHPGIDADDAEFAAYHFFKRNTATLRHLARSLEAMLDDGYYPRNPNLGICYNLEHHARPPAPDEEYNTAYNAAYDLIAYASVSWNHPRHSGDIGYPIPYDEESKWEGEQLEMRRDLMRHALEVVNHEIARRASNYHPQESPS